MARPFQTDPLSQVLASYRLRCFIPGASKLGSPWGVRFERPTRQQVEAHFIAAGLTPPPPPPNRRPQVAGAFFAIIRGQCWLELPQENARIALTAGDIALITRPGPHILRDQPESPVQSAFELIDLRHLEHRPGLTGGGDGPVTTFINGGFLLDDTEDHTLLQSLPPIIHVPVEATGNTSGITATIQALGQELNSSQLGSDGILHHLAHVLLIQILRWYLVNLDDSDSGGWFRGLRDPQIGEAIMLMHSEPQQSWTVASLGEAVAMSRSAFAARFLQVVGQPPLTYLTHCRMLEARKLLQSNNLPVKTIAQRTGYASESSFSNAFKRFCGVSPSAYRSRARSREPQADHK